MKRNIVYVWIGSEFRKITVATWWYEAPKCSFYWNHFGSPWLC